MSRLSMGKRTLYRNQRTGELYFYEERPHAPPYFLWRASPRPAKKGRWKKRLDNRRRAI